MSAFKGTPGVWSRHPRSHAAVINEQGVLVANCGGHASNLRDQGELIAEQEANAHLIAAAPELLEACQALLEATTEDGMTEAMLLGCAIEMAGNAVAKATGGDS